MRQKKLNSRLVYLEDLRRDFAKVPRRRIISPISSFDDSSTPGLDSAVDHVCLTNLLEFSVSLSDWTMGLETLLPFLNTLWKQQQLGSNMKSLSYEASIFDLSLLFMPALRYGRSTVDNPLPLTLRNLTHVSFHLTRSSKISLTSGGLVQTNLRKLLLLLENQLLSLSITASTTQVDIGSLLKSFPYMPNLQRLSYHAPFSRGALLDPGNLSTFIGLYAAHLRELRIRPLTIGGLADDDDGFDSSDSDNVEPRQLPTPRPAGDAYGSWLTRLRGGNRGLSGLVLTELRSLEIRAADVGYPKGPADTKLLPPLHQVTPSLTTLSILDNQLSKVWVEAILDDLSATRGGCRLESLSFCTLWLTPELVDLIYDKLPGLRVLSIEYTMVVNESDGQDGSSNVSISVVPLSLSCMFSAFISQDSGFAHAMRGRKYPNWNLSRIRIASLSLKCKFSHPDLTIMKAIRGCLHSDPILDTAQDCMCPKGT